MGAHWNVIPSGQRNLAVQHEDKTFGASASGAAIRSCQFTL